MWNRDLCRVCYEPHTAVAFITQDSRSFQKLSSECRLTRDQCVLEGGGFINWLKNKIKNNIWSLLVFNNIYERFVTRCNIQEDLNPHQNRCGKF
jgi:hypothetical protein